MRRLTVLFILTVFSFFLRAQSLDNAVQNAFLVSRMVEKFHIQPRPLDDDLSARIYAGLLTELDGQHIFFLQDDITRLAAWRLKLDDEIRDRKTTFLSLLTGIYKQRLQQADTMLEALGGKPFNFSVRETLTAAEDSLPPSGLTGMHTKLYKLVKLSVLKQMGSRIAAAEEKSAAGEKSGVTRAGERSGVTRAGERPAKKTLDSLEVVLRKKAVGTFRRGIQRLLQNPIGIDGVVGTAFCQELASAYDPHTDYFPPEIKEAFEAELGNKPVAFGFVLKEDDAGAVVIGRLIPGSPAFKSGGLNEGDKIVAVQWPDREVIDVSGAGLSEMSRILSAPLGSGNVVLTVKKTDGTRRQVSLYKARLDTEDEEEKVQGFILRGSRTIGYISLPAFYEDWEDSKGVNGCANDVAREIIRLKKENIEGLILDLRYNGGGSVQEAVELAGLFIDAGPVGQIKTRDEKVYTLKDVNRGTIYDGPLVILVNGYSASASEMVAGTLQDYNRALIAGSPTYGKATAQIVLPMDTTISLENYDQHTKASAYIKLTTSRLYRVNGTSAQLSGVKPDILLPDPPSAIPQREADERNALTSTDIPANKYYHPLSPLPLAAARAVAQRITDSSAYFRSALSGNSGKKKGDISLTLDDFVKAPEDEDDDLPSDAGAPPFTVSNPASQRQRLLTDHDLDLINKAYLAGLQRDPYIKASFTVLLAVMIK